MTLPLSWFPLALLCALAWSAADAFSKRALRDHSPPSVLWVRWAYALPLLGAAALSGPLPPIEPPFWAVLLFSSPLEIAAGLLYLEAIRSSPLSLTVPLLAWTPVFTALFSFALLGEVPGPAGAQGILFVAAGSYLLTWTGKGSLLNPFRALLRERGSRCMLAVALIYSVTSALGKIGVRATSPVFFGFTYSLFVTVVYAGVLAFRAKPAAVLAVRPDRWLAAVGIAAGIMMLLHFTAIEMTQVAYMIAVKRSSLLFTVLLGAVFFGERQTVRKLLGAGIMFAGVVLLAWSG